MAVKREKQPAAARFIAPMKATLVNAPPEYGDWIYELKFDGFRTIAVKDGRDVKLYSRNAKEFNARVPEIAEAVAELPIESAVLDGEIVAVDEEGRTSFQLLQGIDIGTERPPIFFYVFDLLNANGAELINEPLHERRKRLRKVLDGGPQLIRFSAEISGDPKKLLEEVRRRGLEGIIGKERNSPYEVDRRSRSWIKLKCAYEQEMIIGGFTPPEGTRQHFGALLVGYYDDGKLQFAGKVGTGFNAAVLKSLRNKMRPLERPTCPFANLPERTQGKWKQNITPGEMRHCHWVEPKLVCQVRLSEWTRDGKLRHPVFLGLREDKDAREVVREVPVG
jgi:bifunctional non-homologous end joining protein LigD